MQPRLGQATFRIAVLDAYERQCAVTQEHSLPALEAAHIRPYAEDGPYEIRNGLLLRADLHRLTWYEGDADWTAISEIIGEALPDVLTKVEAPERRSIRAN